MVNINWVNKMNEMFEANVYTDDERVTVVINDGNRTARVTVLNESVDVDIDGLTDYGAMMVIMATIDRLYNDGQTIMLSPEF